MESSNYSQISFKLNFDDEIQKEIQHIKSTSSVDERNNNVQTTFKDSDEDEIPTNISNRKVKRNRRKSVMNLRSDGKNQISSGSIKRKRAINFNDSEDDNENNSEDGSRTPKKRLFDNTLDDFSSPAFNMCSIKEVSSPAIRQCPSAKRRMTRFQNALPSSPMSPMCFKLKSKCIKQRKMSDAFGKENENFCLPQQNISKQKPTMHKTSSLDETKQRRDALMHEIDGSFNKRFKKYHSEIETIKSYLDNEDENANLIADFSTPYVLPLIKGGKHNDLKAITHETMKEVLDGRYKEQIEKCVIVDCRYPYEYNAGHIQGAMNLFTKDSIIKEFITSNNSIESNKTTTSHQRQNILIFHCEFSSERGPKMYRFLRNKDREINQDNYPYLFYPEIYLLENGYKEFYHNHNELCYPASYKPMLHSDHASDLIKYRAMSKLYKDKFEKRSKTRTSSRMSLKEKISSEVDRMMLDDDDVEEVFCTPLI